MGHGVGDSNQRGRSEALTEEIMAKLFPRQKTKKKQKKTKKKLSLIFKRNNELQAKEMESKAS